MLNFKNHENFYSLPKLLKVHNCYEIKFNGRENVSGNQEPVLEELIIFVTL